MVVRGALYGSFYIFFILFLVVFVIFRVWISSFAPPVVGGLGLVCSFGARLIGVLKLAEMPGCISDWRSLISSGFAVA